MPARKLLLLLALGVPFALVAASPEVPAPATPTAAAEPSTPSAQPAPTPSPWKKSLVSGLSVNQAYFDNWRAGGENSLAWTGGLNGMGAWDRDADLWESNLKLAYGQSKIGELEARKSADSIHVDSTYTRRLNQYVNPYVSVAWDTQFVDGYQYFAGTTFTPIVVSKFMDPGYLTESLGVGYAKGETFRFKIGAAAKQTITDCYPRYADDPATLEVEKTKSEVGASSLTELKLVLGKDTLFTSSLDLFSNLKASDQIDAKWSNLLAAKVSSWLTVNLTMEMTYDKDISTQRQLKQGLNVTFSYNLL
jgi:hypothetical protein